MIRSTNHSHYRPHPLSSPHQVSDTTAQLHFKFQYIRLESMASMAIDLIPLERLLHSLVVPLRKSNLDEQWQTVERTSRELADNLRVRNGPVDNHTILGQTDLPQSLTSLLSLALNGAHIPDINHTSAVLEILRVGANFCMDHDDNRAALLEVGFPQAVILLLEAYAENVVVSRNPEPLPLSIPHLKLVRTSIGVLLNASIGFDPVKFRLSSLEAASTIIKLSSVIYPPTSWSSYNEDFSEEEFCEEWGLRCAISNWGWRTISALKDVQDESLQIINFEVLPWIIPPLLKFCPPHPPRTSPLLDYDPDFLNDLLQADFDFLEETCTLIESLSLDVEDFRLELARTTCYPTSNQPVSCISTIMDFIQHSTYPPLWSSSHLIFEQAARAAKEKAFDICKAALIKAVVEVFGEEKNEEILWKSGDLEHPGGDIVKRMVEWIKEYADTESNRDDLTICASLSLGNLIRQAPVAASLLSSPYSLATTLSSDRFFSPSTDIKLKHGIIGLLKHIAQFSKLSPVIPTSLAQVDIIGRIATSGVWDDRSDAMADVIQLNAIGVAKHMCNASLDHTFTLVLQNRGDRPTGLSQILALTKRSDSVSIKSEGTRVLVNVIKSLWYNERGVESSGERQKKKDACMTTVLTTECASTLTSLIRCSGRYPVLVNEGIVAMTLLCTHPAGGPLVLEALTMPLIGKSTMDGVPVNDSLPTPSSRNDGSLVPEHALDMLVNVLRNADNPVHFPIELRVNTCTFFLQLQTHAPNDSLAPIREIILPVLQQIIDDPQAEEEEKLVVVANQLIKSWMVSCPSA